MKQLATTILICIITTTGFAQQKQDDKGLKDYYKNYFPVGVAVTPAQLKDPAQSALILKNFNSITAENAMKMGPIHPEEDRYNWRDADAIVDFAVVNGLKIRGHNLCWHTQAPRWMFHDEAGNNVTKAVLLDRLKAHIYAVVGRYKGKIYAWDVVNEAISDNPKTLLRNSLWYQICGEDYIAKAFEYAHQADPDAILFYNDYNTEAPEKRERIFQLLKKLKDAGVPVHGVGLQGHWSIAYPSEAAFTATIDRFASLDLQVQVTELDMSIHTDGNIVEQAGDKETRGFTADREEKQQAQYAKMFRVLRAKKGSITGVTFWNLSDRSSWLNNFPIRGRKNFPLLFDEYLMPKKAYWDVVNF
ncbi:MAG: endo-1,4-beta-xylanase [Sphingobacteriaceae bacterium]